MSDKNKLSKKPKKYYTLLTYIDETEDRSYVKLFSNDDQSIKYFLTKEKDLIEGCVEMKLSFEEQYSIFKENKHFPPSRKENHGCFYARIDRIRLDKKVHNRD